MNVLELLVGRLALDRQLISEPLLQHCLQQGGQGLGDVLVAQGFPHDTVQALFAEAQQAQMLCTGCGARYGVPHLIPHDPWACRACGQELILLGNEDSRRIGTGRWNPSGSDYPTSTGSRRVGPANTPGVDTRPGSDRWKMGTPPTHHGGGVAPTGSGSGSWRGSGSGFSASQRFRSKLQPGTVLDGHEILDELGRGGMGIVFKARHLGRGDLVALKVLLAGAMATERQQQRFQREAEALAKLNHPNIVQVFDMGDLGDHMYFTMEFVDGQPLGDQMKTNRVSLRRAVEIARDVAHGLQHAHENEIVHRDIKPDNILIDQSGTPLITDFGLVRDAANEEARLTRSGAVLGTPYYMSPEQASGKGHHLDGSADVYSLGTVLYQMLTGELPFDGQTQIELTKKIIELAPPRPSKINAAVPADLDAIVLKTLAKTPELRYPTAKDFADDLDRFLRGEPVVARPPGRVSAKTMIKILSVLVVVGLLGLGTAVAVKAWSSRPPPPPPTPPVDSNLAETRRAAVAKIEELWRDADRVPIGVYRATLWKLVEATGEALAVAPDEPLLHFRRALVHDRLQKYDEARVGYAKVCQLDPKGELGARAVFHAARLVGRVDDDDAKAGALIADWEQGAGEMTDPPQGPWRVIVRALRLYCADAQNSDQALRLVETAEGLAKVELGEVQTFKSKLLFAKGDMQDAFDVLQQAIRLDPKDATNWAARASFYAAVREDIEQGLKDVERALILDPENLTALELRGTMRVMGKEPERGKRDLERVLQRRPASENALRNMVVLNIENKPERAIELMRRAEASAPTKASVYLLQADVLIDLDRLPEALETLGRGLERLWTNRGKRRRLALRYEELAIGARQIDIMRAFAKQLEAKWAGNALSKVLRGHAAMFESRDPEAAMRFWEGCQKADLDAIFVWERRLRIRHTIDGEDSPEVRREVDRFIAAARQVKSSQGLAYAARYAAVIRKDEALARRLAVAATDADPFDTGAWITRGFVELVHDRTDAGFRFIRRALALTPESSEANYLMGRALLEKGKLDGAIRAFTRSVLLNPFSTEQVTVMCALLLRAKRYKAVMTITGRNGRRLQALKLAPSPTLVLHRARALVGLGKPERSMGLLDEVLKANLQSPKTRRYLAQVLAEAGRLKDAETVLKALVEQFPRDRGSQELLQKVRMGIKRGKQ